jgi:predicted DNA-binding transcriptional regulator AlpA
VVLSHPEKLSVNEILDQLAIGRATLYRYLKYRNVPVSANVQRKTTKHEIIEV